MLHHEAQGASAQKHGKLFEGVVDKILATARQSGAVRYYDRSQPGWRMVKPQRCRACQQPGYVRTERSGADFHGITRDLRPFGIECKSVGPDERLSWRSDFTKKGVVKRQVAHLVALGEYGLLAVEFRRHQALPVRLVMRWDAVPWDRTRGDGSLGLEAAEHDAVFPLSTGALYLLGVGA